MPRNVVRVSYSWKDPENNFQEGEMPIKNNAYYKRSWTAGSPYSSTHIWNDMDHVPEKKRFLIVRPDLSLVAQQRILDKVAQEQMASLEHRQQQQERRTELLEKTARRHIERHERHHALGADGPPQHTFYDHLTNPAPPLSPPPEEEEDLGGETTPQTLEYLRRQRAAHLAPPPTADVAQLSPFSGRQSALRKPPLSATYEGVEALLVPQRAQRALHHARRQLRGPFGRPRPL